MIHLDTSFLIRSLIVNSSEDQRFRFWLQAREPLALSTICWAEFLCGPIELTEIELTARLFPEPVPFFAEDAELAASLFNSSGRKRGSFIDCMIAAIAIRSAAALATSNRKDFIKFQHSGLILA